MNQYENFNTLIEQTIKKNWDYDALTDRHGITLQYHDVARKIAKLHIIFEHTGIKPGDKISICGRNSSMWGVVFLATVTYGAVIVPVQSEFKPEQIYNIVNHSDSRLLFLGDVIAPKIDPSKMPAVEGVLYIPDGSIIESRSASLSYAYDHLNQLFGKKYPKYFRPSHLDYYKDSADELMMINYTSGTTGFSKGVMLPFRSLLSNVNFVMNAIGSRLPAHCDILEILPMGHMYGMTCEFLLQFCMGNHIHFLDRLPSPSVIQKAFEEIHPAIIVSVPLIIEKIIRKQVFPNLATPKMKMLMHVPGISGKIKQRIHDQIMQIMGGQAYEIMTGGASFSKEIEDFFLSVGIPFTVGYGTTETGPLITYSDYHDFEPQSCGTVVDGMEARILNPDPITGAGEILCRGRNLMTGYYKDEQATRQVIDSEGWFHTGDLGRQNSDGHFFILGRIKNMLLASNGENVYPEEIEDKLNSMIMVNESLVLQKGDKFIALVYPDKDEAASMGLDDNDLRSVMEQNRRELNKLMPSYCRISEIRLWDSEFERTPKRSIKRYLYKV